MQWYTEIPLFHVLNARITFGNIFGSEAAAPNVSCIRDAEGSPLCSVVDDSVFEAPSTYSVLGKNCLTNFMRNYFVINK